MVVTLLLCCRPPSQALPNSQCLNKSSSSTPGGGAKTFSFKTVPVLLPHTLRMIVDHRQPGRNGDLLDLAVKLVPEPNNVDKALGTASGSVVMIGRVALLIGEAGNAALTVYNIVEDPLSVPFAILGLVVSPLSVTGRSSRVVFKEACRLPEDVEGCGLEEVWG
jgi:hypothetical protein